MSQRRILTSILSSTLTNGVKCSNRELNLNYNSPFNKEIDDESKNNLTAINDNKTVFKNRNIHKGNIGKIKTNKMINTVLSDEEDDEPKLVKITKGRSPSLCR